jgi:hypothetical protein
VVAQSGAEPVEVRIRDTHICTSIETNDGFLAVSYKGLATPIAGMPPESGCDAWLYLPDVLLPQN